MSEAQSNETQEQAPVKRRGNPMMQKGWAGGPGRPKKVLTAQELLDQQIRRDLKAVAKDHSPEAFRFLLETMRNEDASLQHRLSAATNILDRGWGKPSNHTEIKVDIYDKMSDVELIKLITGKEIDEKAIKEAREPLTIEHEPSDEGEES